MPLSDGGEGTVEIVAASLSHDVAYIEAEGPAGSPAGAPFIRVNDGAVLIECASTVGYTLVEGKRDPALYSSYGLGLMIRRLYEAGHRSIAVGLGGSATSDGGFGMAEALGYVFRDADGEQLSVKSGMPIPGLLSKVHEILPPEPYWIESLSCTALADVNNPLLGDSGAVRTYGPQKGIPAADIDYWERAMEHAAGRVVDAFNGIDPNAPGMGSSGGLGFGLAAFCSARVQPGAAWIAGTAGFDEACTKSDAVLTGEGSIDSQTFYGKVVDEVRRRAEQHGAQVEAFGGIVEEAARQRYDAHKNIRLHCITPPGQPAAEAMSRASENLSRAVEDVLRKYYL